MTKGFAVLLLVLATMTPALADDAAADFSVASNPNGVWTYYSSYPYPGYPSGGPLQYSSSSCGGTGVACWNTGQSPLSSPWRKSVFGCL